MRAALLVAGRELGSYFATPVATVFIDIFLVLSGVLTFSLGNFFARGQADLIPFFSLLPWLLLFLVPALSMRLWAEERRSGTIEMLLTLPITPWQAVLGKFLAAWAVCAIALALTFPLWITVNILGSPDNGVILAGYAGGLAVAGAYLTIGAAVSAMTRNQVIAFVLAIAVCFLFAVSGSGIVATFLSDRLPALAETARALSVSARFDGLMRGVLGLGDVVFFVSFIAFFLFLNTVVLDHRKAD
ncbi:MAG TPA: ABC transporter permease subunit [Crenalkalicoccus sp.]|jgi:ABC-2 type transport system permease protein|nr:ABC transporter permease subunit [Crenalkalicoccus sp.]